MKYFLLLLCAVLSVLDAQAMEQTMELIRQPRTMAMGGAGVGLADDEYSLFHNAAGIAGFEGRGFRPVGVALEGTWDTYTNLGSIMSLASNFTISNLNVLMNKDIAFRASETPMLMLPHFVLAYVVDTQIVVNQYNLVNPNFNLGYMTTHGVQGGTAWSFKKGRRATEELRVGIAAKLMFRKGGFYDVGTAGLLQATGGGRAYLDSLVGNFGTGFGGDVGIQYIKKTSPSASFSIGASITDLGNTKFSDARAMSIPMTANVGFGFKKQVEETKISVGLDFRNLLASTAFSNKTHFGVECDLGVVNLMAGLNQLNPTYGVDFDIWVLKMTFLSYAEELGPAYHQLSSRRAMMQVNFNMPI